MMVVRSKIKWFALFVLIMSLAFLLLHLSIAKSSVGMVQYMAMDGLRQEFSVMSGSRIIRNKRLWGRVKHLESLHPYANPRVSSYPGPSDQQTLFIYAKIYGGFEKIKPAICDLVVISRLLNATLVIPEIQQSTRAKGISYNFKSFSYLYNEEQFIASLKNDVTVVKSLPNHLKESRKRNSFPTFKPKGSTSPNFYIKDVLPKLKKAKVVGLILEDGGCLQSLLPRNLEELQRLRCRVAFHALEFRSEIQELGRRMVERLRAWGQPYLSYHPGLVRETLAYHGCAEIFQDIHTELIQYRRSEMIKKGIVKELNIDSRVQKRKGLCPLLPEEVGIILRGMGYPPKTIIYLAGSELFGGQRILIPLRARFPNIVDRTSLCSIEELSVIIGPESPIPEDTFQFPPPKLEKQLKEEWDKAGPRPRPLPPPPDRPIYRHEKEGWYSWVTERDTEPDPSPSDLRKEAHRLLWDALDYIVSVRSDAFFPGFNNDGSGWPDFSSLVMGQRLYETASARTYRPDRKLLTEFLNTTGDNMYILRRNWSLLVQEHLNKSLEVEGIVRQSRFSKPASFLSHPLPECSCQLSRVDAKDQIKGEDGRVLYGGEDTCPKWMLNEDASIESVGGGVKEENDDENGWEEYESNPVEQPGFSHRVDNANVTLPFDQDEEMDPND